MNFFRGIYRHTKTVAETAYRLNMVCMVMSYQHIPYVFYAKAIIMKIFFSFLIPIPISISMPYVSVYI